jgi:hypothetical protein
LSIFGNNGGCISDIVIDFFDIHNFFDANKCSII